MLQSVDIENFKSFGEGKSNIGFGKITLLFGANSAGKSSIIKSILLLKNAFIAGTFDTHQTVFSGENVDLGGIYNMLNKKKTVKDIYLGYEFKMPVDSKIIPKDNVKIGFSIGLDEPNEYDRNHGSRGVKELRIEAGGANLFTFVGANAPQENNNSFANHARVIYARDFNTENPILKNIIEDTGVRLKEALSESSIPGNAISPDDSVKILLFMLSKLSFSERSMLERSPLQEVFWSDYHGDWSAQKVNQRERCRIYLSHFMRDFFEKNRDKIQDSRSDLEESHIEGDVSSFFVFGEFKYFDELNDDDFGENIIVLQAELFELDIVKKGLAQHEGALDVLGYFLDDLYGLLEDIFHEANRIVSDVNYLGPLRRIPAKLARREVNLHDEELKSWNRLLTDDKIREEVNRWLSGKFGMRYQVEVRRYYSGNSLNSVTRRAENFGARRAILETSSVPDRLSFIGSWRGKRRI